MQNPFNKIDVQLCKPAEKIPEGESWLFELKYDGYRIVSFTENGTAKLVKSKRFGDTSFHVYEIAVRL